MSGDLGGLAIVVVVAAVDAGGGWKGLVMVVKVVVSVWWRKISKEKGKEKALRREDDKLTPRSTWRGEEEAEGEKEVGKEKNG